MREVILTAGPRGAGKSTFCEKALALEPSMKLVSRDDILIKLFGKTSLDPYTGGHQHAEGVMWVEVEKALDGPSDTKLILDAWNGTSRERWEITKRLRSLGIDKITAWLFVTPVELVEEWFWYKPDTGHVFPSGAPRRDWETFHRLAKNIDSDGFDEVVRINPITMSPECVLMMQTSLKL